MVRLMCIALYFTVFRYKTTEAICDKLRNGLSDGFRRYSLKQPDLKRLHACLENAMNSAYEDELKGKPHVGNSICNLVIKRQSSAHTDVQAAALSFDVFTNVVTISICRIVDGVQRVCTQMLAILHIATFVTLSFDHS